MAQGDWSQQSTAEGSPTPRPRPPGAWFQSSTTALAQLANVRLRPTIGPYAWGKNFYDTAQAWARSNAFSLGNWLARGTGLNQIARVASDNVRRRRGEIIAATKPLPQNRLAEQLARATGRPYQEIVDELNGKTIIAKAQTAPAAPKPAPNTRPTTRPLTGRAGSPGLLGVAGAGNALISQYTDLYYQQKRIRERNERLRRATATNRRGAAASRPVLAGSPGTTNRTGAGSTRPIDPVPSPKRAPSAAKLPGNQPTVGQVIIGAPNYRRDNVPGTRTSVPIPTRSAQVSTPSRWKMSISTRAPTLEEQLRSAFRRVAPRVAVRGSDLATLLNAPGAPQTAALTGSKTQLLGFTGPQTLTRSKTDDCNCEGKKKTKQSEPRCRNPVISRTTRDGIRTTKTRITCPPSRQNSR